MTQLIHPGAHVARRIHVWRDWFTRERLIHKWHDSWPLCIRDDSFICEMSHSYVTRLNHMCDMTYSYVSWLIWPWFVWFIWNEAHLYVTQLPYMMWLNQMWYASFVRDVTHDCSISEMAPSYIWQDSFICLTWIIRMCDMTHSYVWHDSFVCVTWLSHR